MKREDIKPEDLERIVGGVDYTVKQEPDKDNPEQGYAYIYVEGVMVFKFWYDDQKECDDIAFGYIIDHYSEEPEPFYYHPTSD